MELFLSLEGQNCTGNGLSAILFELQNKLHFLRTPDNVNPERYGAEFDSISIIPTCVSDRVWIALGWKERILLKRKKHEADIRLRMDYEKFVKANDDKKREMFVQVIIDSIRAIQTRSKDDFNGEVLIEDILKALKE